MDAEIAIGAERLPTLEGARNFRDLGGYALSDGRNVKCGVLFRSGSLAGLTREDWNRLRNHGVRTLCDLRTTRERDNEPYAWSDTFWLSCFSRDYETSFGELRTLMAAELPDTEAVRRAMIKGYRELPFEQAPAYRQLFFYLKQKAVPLIFNCSAGKDRTGTAAALVLSALGVSREVVIKDYLRTNENGRLHEVTAQKNDDGARHRSMLARLPQEIVASILDADIDYISAALDSIEDRHSSITNYLHDILDVSAQDIDDMRAYFLE